MATQARRLTLTLILAVLAGCRGGGVAGPAPVVSSAAVATDAAAPPLASSDVAAACDPETLRVVLDDPRLARAKERERAREWSAAAHEVDEARKGATLSPEEQCGWGYVKGRLHVTAGENAEAAAELDKVLACAGLKEYAALRASQAYARLGNADEAIARARAAGEAIAMRDEAKLVLAEALATKGDRAAAVPIWRSVLGSQPRASRWVDTSVRLATALLDGMDGDPAARANEALELATRVVVEAPKMADSSGATATRSRAVAVVRAKDPSASDALGDADRARRAQVWLEIGEPDRALAEANAILADARASHAITCKAASTAASAQAKNKPAAADAWGKAIAACADDALAAALYQGAKASSGAKRPQEALDRFAEVEKKFPKHRLADDARFQSALLAQQAGDDAAFLAKMGALPTDYPEGDMRAEALFRVALFHMVHGDWEAAKAPLDKIVEITPRDRHWMTAGRAAYFRARAAAATGDLPGARKRWSAIVAEVPLSFYMTQAHARLRAIDATEASRLLEEGSKREEPGAIPMRDVPAARAEAFALARRLLEVGEIEWARREVARSGANADDAPAESLWCVGRLYSRAGAPDLGHAFARGRATEFLEHYPSGRWRTVWEAAFPKAYEPLVARETSARAVEPALAWAIMREESDFVAEAKSPSNAFGLMQLIIPTAKMVAKGTGLAADEASLKRPEVNIALGTKHLGELKHAFPSNVALAIASYNAGAGAVGRWLDARGGQDFDLWVEQIPFDETRGYVKRVVASMAAYAYLYDTRTLSQVLSLPARAER